MNNVHIGDKIKIIHTEGELQYTDREVLLLTSIMQVKYTKPVMDVLSFQVLKHT